MMAMLGDCSELGLSQQVPDYDVHVLSGLCIQYMRKLYHGTALTCRL